MKKLKDETYKGVRIKFYYDNNKVVAQPYGLASPISIERTKSEAFKKIKPKIRRGNL